MRIQHNIAATFAATNLKKTGNRLMNTTERLSSGYKINRASDNAAGLTISEKLRSQIRGLLKAQDNIQDGISYCSVADGALNEVQSMLDRIKELSVKASSDTYTDDDRRAIDAEIQQLGKEINNVFSDTEFNTIKLWQAAYAPDIGGDPKDFFLYQVADDYGEHIGGISYLNHRYSWNDLGIGWDSSTYTFTEDTSYVIDTRILRDDITTAADDYMGSARFTLTTKAGEPVVKLEKSYDWSADNNGIYIDGVMTDGSNPAEGNTTWSSMGITPGSFVYGGTYSFNYYGIDVSFDVPDEGAGWTEFLSGINNPLAIMDWRSVYSGSASRQTANIYSATNRLIINSSNKEYISTDSSPYSINADESGIWITNGSDASVSLSKSGSGSTFVSWESMGIKSWGTDVNDNNESRSDSMPSSGSDNNTGSNFVTLNKDSYSYNTRDFALVFKLSEQASSSKIAAAIDASGFTNRGIISPTEVQASLSGGSTGRFGVSGESSTLSFITERDDLGRSFASDTEHIANGRITESAGFFKLTLNGSYELISTQSSDSFKSQLKNAILSKKNSLENALDRVTNPSATVAADISLGLGKYSLTFRNGSDTISVGIDLSGLKYADTADIDDIVNCSMTAIINDSTVSVNGAGATVQNLGLNQPFTYNSENVHSSIVDGFTLSLDIQAGASSNQFISVQYDYMRLGTLGLRGSNVRTRGDAELLLSRVDKAIDKVSEQRSIFGAATNRLEHASSINLINAENMQAADTRLRDADITDEMMAYAKDSILQQIGQSVLAQANQNASNILTLLQ